LARVGLKSHVIRASVDDEPIGAVTAPLMFVTGTTAAWAPEANAIWVARAAAARAKVGNRD
jgi:hypothetical protein